MTLGRSNPTSKKRRRHNDEDSESPAFRELADIKPVPLERGDRADSVAPQPTQVSEVRMNKSKGIFQAKIYDHSQRSRWVFWEEAVKLNAEEVISIRFEALIFQR